MIKNKTDSSKPFRHKPKHLMQCAQMGGKPVVAVYENGILVRIKYLVAFNERTDETPDNLMKQLPAKLLWQGTRKNFKILGQTRHKRFEALASFIPDDVEPSILCNFVFAERDVAKHHDIPTCADRGVDDLNRYKKSKVLLLTSVYKNRIRFSWYNPKTNVVHKNIIIKRI